MKFHKEKKQLNKLVNNLNSGEILVVAGKGHENIQDYGKSKDFFLIKYYSKIYKEKKIKNYQII